MTEQYDAVVIGAGSNGLAAAAYLAKGGQRVLVVEQRDVIGGRHALEEFAPGFRASVERGSGWLPDRLVKDLDLNRHGLKIVKPDSTVFAPQPDGSYLTLWPDVARTASEIQRFSEHDARQWPKFCRFVKQVTQVFETAYLLSPPDGLNVNLSELPALAGLALQARRLGDRDMVEFLRVIPMAAQEFFDYWFESDSLKGTLGADAVLNIRQGPRSAGTTFMFLHHQIGNPEGTFRPQRHLGIVDAFASVARTYGVEIRTGACVRQILVENGRAVGVMLAEGSEIRARQVVSSLDATSTFLDKVDQLELPPTFVRAVRNIKYRGAVAVIHLALGDLPVFTSAPAGSDHLQGTISISPSLDYLEHAYDASKYGQISERPALEVSIPSLSEPGLAPAGQHVMSIHAQFAPYQLRDGASWDGNACSTLLNRVLDTLSEYAPNIRNAILHTHVITPQDLETTYSLTEGSLYQGEMMLDQLFFMRPVAGYAQYRSPIDRLYLCGAAAHPGGSVIGVPAYNAAREILNDTRKNK